MDNGNAPATKKDLENVRSEVKQDLENVRSELKQDIENVKQEIEMSRSEFHHGFDDLKEALRDSQTELLKAFYNFAQSYDERVTATEHESASLKKRLAIMETRIMEVERRLNMPPQPFQ